MKTVKIWVALVIVFIGISALAVCGSDADAANEDAPIDVGRGQVWYWLPEFDESLGTVTLSVSLNGVSFDQTAGYATVEGQTVVVRVPNTADLGTYPIIIKAESTQPNQNAITVIPLNIVKAAVDPNPNPNPPDNPTPQPPPNYGSNNKKSVFTFLDGVATYTGSTQTAGLLIYVVIMILILVFMRQAKSRFFFIAVPVTLIMAGLGVLKSEVMYIVLMVNIIGIVVQYKKLK